MNMKRRDFLTSAAAVSVSVPLLSRLEAMQLTASARSASMWTYLWDLVDEGYASPLQMMKESGLTHVSLAAAYHAGRFLLPHNPRRKVYFLEDGTVYFKPTPELYGKIKPRPNSLVKNGEHFAIARKHAEKHGLRLNAWVVCCHNTPLGQAHPDITCVDAFGDRLTHNLCPANPDVRTYLRGVVKDLAQQGAERIELEAMQFQGYAHGFHHERDGITLTAAHRLLLGLCFCESCFRRSSGSVNLVPIQRYVRTTLEGYFADPTAAPFLTTLADLPQDLFAPLLEWRKNIVFSLAQELQESIEKSQTVLRPLVSFDPGARDMSGIDLVRIATVTGGVLMPGYVKDGPALRQPLRAVQAAVGEKQVIVGFQVGLPESGGRTEFLDRLKTAREMGIQDFNFYNYGLIPLTHLQWIKEGVA